MPKGTGYPKLNRPLGSLPAKVGAKLPGKIKASAAAGAMKGATMGSIMSALRQKGTFSQAERKRIMKALKGGAKLKKK